MLSGGAYMSCVNQAAKALQVVHSYITTGMDTNLDVAMDLLDIGEEGQEESVNKLKEIMLEYSEMDRDMQQFIAATNHVIKEGMSEEDVDLEAMLEDKLEQLKQNNTEDELYHNEKYVDLMEKIKSLEKEDVSCKEEELVEDVAVTQKEVHTKCPYTGMEMTDPVRNKICGHNYDRNGIMACIKNRKGRAKCPLPGCINDKPISPNDLEENRELKRLIERRSRENQRKR